MLWSPFLSSHHVQRLDRRSREAVRARSPTGLLEKPICRLGSADIRALSAVAGGFFAAVDVLASMAGAGLAFAIFGRSFGVEPVTGMSTGPADATTTGRRSGRGGGSGCWTDAISVEPRSSGMPGIGFVSAREPGRAGGSGA